MNAYWIFVLVTGLLIWLVWMIGVLAKKAAGNPKSRRDAAIGASNDDGSFFAGIPDVGVSSHGSHGGDCGGSDGGGGGFDGGSGGGCH